MNAPPDDTTTIGVVVLAYGAEPGLGACVDSVLASVGVRAHLVVVDNGTEATDVLDRMRSAQADGDPVTVVGSGVNLGYSGGNNLGAAHAPGEFLALVNSDAVLDPDALARLVAVAARPEVGLAGGGIRLSDRPDLLNSGGNEVHFCGYSWCGDYERPAVELPTERPVVSLMGATVVLRRAVWDEVGGFDDHYFAYHEDVDLSFGCRLRGYELRWVRDAVVLHAYEFGRVPSKLGLSERNRLVFVLTTFERSTLAAIAPALVVNEVGTLGLALLQGWLPQKLAGWWWIICHAGWIRDRRRVRQQTRVVGDEVFLDELSTRLSFQPFPLPLPARVADRLLAAYWRAARRLLPASPGASGPPGA